VAIHSLSANSATVATAFSADHVPVLTVDPGEGLTGRAGVPLEHRQPRHHKTTGEARGPEHDETELLSIVNHI